MVIYIRIDKEDEGYYTDEERQKPRPEKRPEDLEGVLIEYYIYPVFRKKIIDKLPNRTVFNYKIKLKPGTELKYYKSYYLGPY
jgi:hypothetical protein